MENILKCNDYIIKHSLLIRRKKICDHEIPKCNTDAFIIRDGNDFITTSIGFQWIKYVKTEPPEWMRNVNFIDGFGNSFAMHWLIHIKTPFPSWMKQNPLMKNKDGNTCCMLWIKYVKTEPPDYIMHSPLIINNNGETLSEIWIRTFRTNPPEQ